MIAIINYGLGNVAAISNVYQRLGLFAVVANKSEDLAGASHLILPGVGAFDHAMELLNQSGMREELDKLVIHDRIPVLGICVGMQMMAKRSDEGSQQGLGWVPGEVVRLRGPSDGNSLMLPHMGWNDVFPRPEQSLFVGLEVGAKFYFLHSFAFSCANDDQIAAEADYGGRFTCAVHTDNVFGVQFHPEKSHQSGVRLLENFGRLD